MASGLKEGPPPGRIWVIKSAYEIRYYTTPETIAQAIVDGYDGEVAVYRLAEETHVDKDVNDILQRDPTDPEPRYPKLANSSLLSAVHGYKPLSAADQKLLKQYERNIAAWKKRRRAKVIEVLTS